jgi:hypothetical protein
VLDGVVVLADGLGVQLVVADEDAPASVDLVLACNRGDVASAARPPSSDTTCMQLPPPARPPTDVQVQRVHVRGAQHVEVPVDDILPSRLLARAAGQAPLPKVPMRAAGEGRGHQEDGRC